MNVKLIAHTVLMPDVLEDMGIGEAMDTDADMLCGIAAAQCTGYEGYPTKALTGALSSGHTSVSEHAMFSFRITGVSRVLLAQLTRHRIASYSVKSQRYCKIEIENITFNDTDEYFYVPESMDKVSLKNGVSVGDDYRASCMLAAYKYIDYIEAGVDPEDARYVLPQGIKTDLIMTMDLASLLHFLSLRCCNRAQKEIRDLARQILKICKEMSPIIFANAGPGCVRGHCPEGGRSCGRKLNED